MSDIFISYASEDRDRAKLLAEALTGEGWSIWWDRNIPFGKTFDKVIEDNLAAAKCVIVLWTKHSIGSSWVRAEASEGVNRDALIPVLLENDIKIPLEFKLLQAANLTDWKPAQPHAEFQRLLDAIKVRLSPNTNAGSPSTTSNDVDNAQIATDSRSTQSLELPSKKHGKAFYVLGLLVLPSVVIGGLALSLMNWRIPTRVQLDLHVDRVAFTVAGAEPVAILDKSINFQSLSIEAFEKIAFKPAKLQMADMQSGAGETVWNDMRANQEIVLRGKKNDFPAVIIDTVETTTRPTGKLEAITVNPGTQVILETNSDPNLILRVDGQRLTPAVLPLSAFRLSAVHTSADGLFAQGVANQAGTIVLKAELPENNPLIEVESQAQALVLTLTPVKNGSIDLLAKNGAPIQQIDFTRQNTSGGREASLAAAGEITYPDYPARDKVTVDQHDFIGLGKLEKFFITRLNFDQEKKQIELRLMGVAGQIQTLSGAIREDRRLTRFDTLWHGSKQTVLFSILVWVFSVTVGAYKLYKDLAG